tara:strand:+ start:145 stop:294 length:150 start_codon:yes stop_codon:yes gene_type:complete
MSNRITLERNGSEIEVWEHQAEFLISKGWQRAADENEAITEEEDDDGES